MGTRFCYADMRDADLQYCFIHEADFTGANLTNAKFIEANAYAGIQNCTKWVVIGYQRVSFRHADLTNADFRRTGIYNADFTDAIMDGTVFLEKQLARFELSDKQIQSIKIEKI